MQANTVRGNLKVVTINAPRCGVAENSSRMVCFGSSHTCPTNKDSTNSAASSAKSSGIIHLDRFMATLGCAWRQVNLAVGRPRHLRFPEHHSCTVPLDSSLGGVHRALIQEDADPCPFAAPARRCCRLRTREYQVEPSAVPRCRTTRCALPIAKMRC